VSKIKILVTIIVIATFSSIYAILGLSVDNSITSDDEKAILSLRIEEKCENSIGTYEKEIECLRSIQAAVQSIGEKRCAVAADIVEPSEFLKRNYGCCFDRARFIEKSARYFGYETRHIFLIQPNYIGSLTNSLPLGQASHATSEILTTNGWIGVDSIDPFILIGADSSPYTYRHAISNLNEFPSMVPQHFYQESIDVIYGLYSRHGKFHGRNFPGPEFVFSELKWNWQ